MDGEVETHQVNEGIVLAEAEKVGQVVGVILGGVNGRELALAVKVVVDSASDARKLGNTRIDSHEFGKSTGSDGRETIEGE